MQEFVALENIKRFQAKLEVCTAQKQREVLTELLECEYRKLDAIRTYRHGHVPAEATAAEPNAG